MSKNFPGISCVPVKMMDGRVLYLDLTNPVSVPYLLDGKFKCEEVETDLARDLVKRGDKVIDVGANVGWYSTLFCEEAGNKGKVYAFEPNKYLIRLLNNLSKDYPQLQINHAAVGEENGEKELNITENWISGSLNMDNEEEREIVEKQKTKMISLDSFLKNTNSEYFIKLDEEGSEKKM